VVIFLDVDFFSLMNFYYRQKMDGLTIDNEIMLNSGIKCCKFDASLDIGIVATIKGVLWYVNWLDNSTVRLVSTHNDRITSLCCINNTAISSCSEDGTLRIWSLDDREQIAQFEVKTPVNINL
jgi:WD40 repeat protein